jgi:hypothetical protein
MLNICIFSIDQNKNKSENQGIVFNATLLELLRHHLYHARIIRFALHKWKKLQKEILSQCQSIYFGYIYVYLYVCIHILNHKIIVVSLIIWSQGTPCTRLIWEENIKKYGRVSCPLKRPQKLFLTFMRCERENASSSILLQISETS